MNSVCKICRGKTNYNNAQGHNKNSMLSLKPFLKNASFMKFRKVEVSIIICQLWYLLTLLVCCMLLLSHAGGPSVIYHCCHLVS